MKRILLILIITLCCNCKLLFSLGNKEYIQNYFSVVNKILLPIEFNDKNNIRMTVFKDTIFVMNCKIIDTNDKKAILLYNTDSRVKQFIYLPKYIFNELKTIHDFALNDNFIAIIYFNSILMFDIKNNNTFCKKFDSIPNDKIKLTSKYLLAATCNFKNRNDTSMTKFIKISLDDFKIVAESYIQDPKGIVFTLFQPKNLFDMNENSIIITDAVEYSVRIFDWNFQQIDSINIEPNNWIKIDSKSKLDIENISKIYGNYLKELIDTLRYFTENFSFCHKIHFINDTTVLLNWSVPSKNNKAPYNYYYDLIIFQNNKWKGVSTTTNMPFDFDTPIINFNHKWNILNNYNILNNFLFEIESIPFVISDSDSNITINLLKENIKDYYITNDNLRYTIIKMKYIP
mgnify:CR=1 FL=1